MKYGILATIALLFLMVGCSDTSTAPAIGSVSLGTIQAKIESSYREGDAKRMLSLIDKTDMPAQLIELSEKFLIMGHENHTEVSSSIYSIDEYKPKMDLPGAFDGKKLKYNFEPSHWVVLVAEPDPNPSNSVVEMVYPIFERDGLFYISGGTWE